MFCIYCGNKLDDDSVFCPTCGKKLSAEESGQAVQARTEEPSDSAKEAAKAEEPVKADNSIEPDKAAEAEKATATDSQAENVPETAGAEESKAVEERPQPAEGMPASKATKVFCIHCGNKLDGDSVFCPTCGKRQLKEEKAVAGQASTASGAKKARIITKLSFALFVLSSLLLLSDMAGTSQMLYGNRRLPHRLYLFFCYVEDYVEENFMTLLIVWCLSSISYFLLKIRGVILRKNFMSMSPLGRNILAFFVAFFAAVLITGIVAIAFVAASDIFF